ncbi:ATP-binding protein [Streptomyces rimosus]|uniref:ATP-binding protein n=1 Tax=Streptomyces rimosus TaxID=1927 RepID=UPI0004C8579F|nr:ATP-binding protein [Streptomyces rimosus]
MSRTGHGRRAQVAPVASPRTFAGDAKAPGRARKHAREVIEAAVPDITGDRLAIAQLVVSELVTNAYRYGTEPGDRIAVTVDAAPEGARIEVHDPARRRPKLRAPGRGRERGRGLYVVQAIADRWGVDDRPFGKVVWVEPAWH